MFVLYLTTCMICIFFAILNTCNKSDISKKIVIHFFAIPWVKIDQINERLGFGALLCRLDLISDQRWVEWELHRWQLDLGGTGKNGQWTISPPRQCANRAERASRGSKQGWRERANVAIKEQGGQRASSKAEQQRGRPHPEAPSQLVISADFNRFSDFSALTN